MPEWQRRILSTFAVRSRRIAHGYDPLTGRRIRGEPVLACCESAGNCLGAAKPVCLNFVEAARSRLDIRGIGHEPRKPSARMAEGE
jgi:hypothetical protein